MGDPISATVGAAGGFLFGKKEGESKGQSAVAQVELFPGFSVDADLIDKQGMASVITQVAGLDPIFKAQEFFGPKFTGLELDLLKEFGPQFLEEQVGLEEEFGPRLAQATRDQQGILAPERIAGQDVVADFLKQDALLSPQEEEQFRADTRAATSVRGLGDSGPAALEEVRQLTGLRQQLKTQKLNVGLSAAGRVPITPAGSVQQPQFSSDVGVQNVSPGDIFGLAQQGLQSSTALKINKEQGKMKLLGSILGLGGDIGGAAIGAFASSAKYKHSIKDNEVDSIQVIKDCNIKNFRYNEDVGMFNKEYVGVIAEEAPEILVTQDRDKFDVYSAVGILLDANKKLVARVEELEGRVA